MKFGLTLIKRGLNYHKRNKMAEYTTQELQEMLDQQIIASISGASLSSISNISGTE